MNPSNTARQTQESPGEGSYAITPTDNVEVGAIQPRALYVGGGGDISMMLEGDTAPTLFASVPAGVIMPLKVRVVMSTGTTAVGLVALY